MVPKKEKVIVMPRRLKDSKEKNDKTYRTGAISKESLNLGKKDVSLLDQKINRRDEAEFTDVGAKGLRPY